jgi:hypothetical protein
VLPTDGEVLFSEDFEGQAVRQRPDGWDDFVGWQKNNTNNTPSAANFAVVDSEQAFNSSNAIHFKGGSNPAQITRPLPSGTSRIYVSARVYMTRQLGQNPGANHETLIAIRGESGAANDEIRFGEIKGVIGTNEVPSDNISPLMDQWGMGPVVPANTWACFEVAFLGDAAQHELHAWVDGVEVHSITVPDQWQNGAMPATWMDGKFLEVVFGWHSFSSQDIDVWMDDITVATARQGCP